MRNIFLFIILFFIGCKTKENSTTSIESIKVGDSIEAVDHFKEIIFPTDDLSLDSALYIGYVNYFPETNEFYTTLYTKPGLSQNFRPELDSTVYVEENGIKRNRISKQSLNAFILSGLRNIIIYNDKHQKVAEAKFVRGESFEDEISSQFIAIFKANEFQWWKGMLYYCVSNSQSSNSNFSCNSFTAHAYKGILSKLKKDTLGWKIKHYHVMPADIIYSVMSSENESLLTEFRNGEVSILNDVKDDYCFDTLLPLPYQVNDRPLMLISASVFESDVSWNCKPSVNYTLLLLFQAWGSSSFILLTG